MFLETRVIHVDTEKYSVSTISTDGRNVFDDVSYVTTGLTPGGLVEHPQYGDVIVISIEEDGQARFHKHYSSRYRNSDGDVAYKTLAEKFKNFTALPGDRTLQGPDGAWLNLLRGRLASVGSSPLCQTVYLGLEGLIRTVCQNYDAMGSGFRVYSLNEDGKIRTRLSFTSNDLHFVNGADGDCPSESFEYQIDFDTDGISLAVGKVSEGKRKNKFSFIIRLNGEINISIGDNTQYTLYDNGMSEFLIMGPDKKDIYKKTVSVTTDGASVVTNEYIKGIVNRYVDGNVNEIVKGDRTITARSLTLDAVTIETTADINKKVSGVNMSEIKKTPKARASSR